MKELSLDQAAVLIGGEECSNDWGDLALCVGGVAGGVLIGGFWGGVIGGALFCTTPAC